MSTKLKKTFLALDLDGDGYISVAELDAFLRSIKRKLRMSDEDITIYIKVIKAIDQNGDGKVDLEQFLDIIQNLIKRETIHKALVQRSGIRKEFEKYDKDGKGVITKDEFRRVVEDKYQSKLMPSQLDTLMADKNKLIADKNKNGTINYEQFLTAFTYFPVTK